MVRRFQRFDWEHQSQCWRAKESVHVDSQIEWWEKTSSRSARDEDRCSLVASSENLEHSMVGGMEDEFANTLERSCIQHRANTTMHVCWHRNLSVSINDHRQSIKNQLSGYLLRKFKNSNGWQKLWVVFTNFCLFFYKTYQVRSTSTENILTSAAHRRMIFHWHHCRYSAIAVHCHRRPMAWIKITYLNFNSRIMSTFSVLKVNTHLIG
jgi:hypothetical protein